MPHPIEELTSPASWALVEGKFSPYAKQTLATLVKFVQEEVEPALKVAEAQLPTDPELRWKTEIPILEELKAKARKCDLWNHFLSKSIFPRLVVGKPHSTAVCWDGGSPWSVWATCFRIGDLDTGNMAFSMAECFVASSDATNIQTSIRQDGNEIVIGGHKWYISGAGYPRCKLHIVMGKHDLHNKNPHLQQSIVLVPADTLGVKVIRPMHVFGYDDAPEGRCETINDDVRVPFSNLGIIQGRLGPGRIHHCMRSIGVAQYALDLMIQRATDPSRKTFGKYLHEHGTVIADIATSRAEIEASRLLVLSEAHQIDKFKAKGVLKEIGMAKVRNLPRRVIDRAIRAYGVSQDTPLARLAAGVRTLRIADGPDAVYIQEICVRELKRAKKLHKLTQPEIIWSPFFESISPSLYLKWCLVAAPASVLA